MMAELAVSPEADRLHYDKLVELARPHVDKSDGLLDILEYDDIKPEIRSMDTYMVPGQVADIELMDLIGNTVVKGFHQMSEDLMPEKRRQHFRKTLRGGKSIYLATSHEHLIDPAIGLGAVTNPLRREKDEADVFETGIIINKMVTVLKYRVGEEWMSCMQVLQWLCDRSYLTYPQSETFRASGIVEALPSDHFRANNAKVKKDMAPWLAKGGVVLGVATSGSTHKWNDNDERTERVVPELTEGTARTMTQAEIRVSSLILDLKLNKDGPTPESDPFIEACGKELIRIRRWRQAQRRIPRSMIKALNEHSAADGAGKPYVYAGRTGLRGLMPGPR